MTTTARPARGTRPANRRQLIADAAADLFARRGYENVGMGDVAEAVAVGPSALYRHFPGKEPLLVHVVSGVVVEFEHLLDEMRESGLDLSRVATFGLEHRTTAALLEREARHLPPDQLAEVRGTVRAVRQGITALLAQDRPELREEEAAALGGAVLALALSVSFHRVTMDASTYTRLVTSLMERVHDVTLPTYTAAPAPATTGLGRTSRREHILATATRLFADRTFASVSMEDLSAEAGLAPSSIYKHFPSKVDMLVAALHRADGWLQLTMTDILAEAPDARTALEAVMRTYARFALQHPDLVGLLVREVRSLPSGLADPLLRPQREYLDELVTLLCEIDPDLDEAHARVTVHAALSVANDLARVSDVRGRGDAPDLIATLCIAVLGLDAA